MASQNSYTLVTSTGMMENHIPASVLDSHDEFFALQTQSRANVLLSIGNDNILRSAVSDNGGQTGWTTLDISPLIDGQAVAKSFAASYNSGTNIVTVLLVLTSTASGTPVDSLYAVSGPTGVDPAIWLVDSSQMTFTPLPFDAVTSQQPYNITTGSLTIDGVYVEAGLSDSDPLLQIATVVDSVITNRAWCFIIDQSMSSAWTYYIQEQNLGVSPPVQIVTGSALSQQSSGIYKLYALGGQQTLSFLPSVGLFGGDANAVIYQTPAGADAIASLVYKDSNGNTVSDLFVAGDGTLTWFPVDTREHQGGTVVVNDPLIAGTAQLHAVNALDKVLIWGVNSAQQVFYTAANFADRGTTGAWQKPLPLLVNTTVCAPIQGVPSGEADLFAFADIPSSLTASQTTQGMIHLGRNATTGHWNTYLVGTPTTTDAITLRSYTTRVLLTDSRGVPQPNQTITVSPSMDCALILNGLSTLVTADTPFTVTTDGMGNANIIHGLSSLAAVSFTFTLPDASTVTVDPSGAVEAKMKSISQASDLTSQTYVAADGTTQPLVKRGTSPDAVSGSARAINTLANHSLGLPRARDLAVRPKLAALPPLQENESFFEELGDLVQYVMNVADQIVDISLQALESGFHIVIQVEQEFLSAVISTAEDVYAAITTVLKWIGAALDEVFRWLAFLFDWKTYVAVAGIFEETVTGILTNFSNVAQDAKEAVDAWFASAIAHIDNTSSPLSRIPSTAVQAAWSSNQPSSYAVGDTDTRSDTRMGWVKDRVGSIAGLGSGGASAAPVLIRSHLADRTMLTTSRDSDDPFNDIGNAISSLAGDFEKAVSGFEQSVVALANGTIDTQTFLKNLATTLETLGLSSAQSIFDDIMVSVEELVPDLDSILDTPIDIPVLSPLYKAVTGQDLTILNLICLLLGIAFSILYELATGNDPETDLDQGDVSSTLPAVMTDITSYIGSPGQSTARLPKRFALAETGGSSRTYQLVSDIALMLRSITIYAQSTMQLLQANEPDPLKRIGSGLINIVYLADLSLRLVALGCKLSAGTEGGGKEQETGGEMVVAGALTFFLLGDLTRNPGPSIGGALREIDDLAAFALGIWQIVELSKSCPDTTASDIMDISEKMLALPQMISLFLLAKAKGSVGLAAAAYALGGLRALSSLAAGAIELSESTLPART